jgi:hypothetical protein
VAVGQSQRLYSGVGIFNWYYLSSPPQVLRVPEAPLELGGLTSETAARRFQISEVKRPLHNRFGSEVVKNL